MGPIILIVISLILILVLVFSPTIFYFMTSSSVEKKKEDEKIAAFRVYSFEELVAEHCNPDNSLKIRMAAYNELFYRGHGEVVNEAIQAYKMKCGNKKTGTR